MLEACTMVHDGAGTTHRVLGAGRTEGRPWRGAAQAQAQGQGTRGLLSLCDAAPPRTSR